MSPKPIIRPARTSDAPAVTAIYNQGIAERRATFETQPRRVDDMASRISGAARYPMLVAVDDTDRPIGWGGLSEYRPRDCYAGIAEFSLYLDSSARGRGLGRRLMDALTDAARDAGCWKLVSRIFTFNAASRAICRASGFREVGIYEKHAQLDGEWLDVVIVERLIPENLRTRDESAEVASTDCGNSHEHRLARPSRRRTPAAGAFGPLSPDGFLSGERVGVRGDLDCGLVRGAAQEIDHE